MRTRRTSTPGRWRSTRASWTTPTGTSGGSSMQVEEMGDLDNTLIFYIWGDNGASLEGTVTGSFNEMTFLNGLKFTPTEQLELIDKYGGIDGLGRRPHGAAYRRRVGVGRQHAVPVGQADGEPSRAGRETRWWSPGPAKIEARGEIRSQFTHCTDIGPDDPRGGRHPGAESGRRDRAGADGRHELPLHVRRSERRGAAHRAVLRGDRLARDVQGRLVGLRTPRQGAVGLLTGGARALRAGQVGSRAGHLGAVLPAGRLHTGEGPGGGASREARRTEGALLAGGGAQPRAAAARFDLRLLRHSAAVADDHPLHVRRRRPERAEGAGAANRGALIRARGRARGARGRGGGRDSCERGLHRWLRPLGRRRRQAQPHVLVPRRRELPADIRQAAPDRRRLGQDAVRGR